MSDWRPLAAPSPDLYRARLQLHHALQIAASVGHTHAPPVPDQSHSSFAWSHDLGALIGRSTPEGYRAGLRFDGPTLLLLDAGANVQASFDLVGHPQGEGYRWLAHAITTFNAGADAEADGFVRSPYDLPEHPAAEGAPFSADPLHAELARWFADADRILDAIAAEHEGASPVRCWPHHFDLATLISLDPDARDPETARSVGVGMTPGDASLSEPYWYVTPWPYPQNPTLPDLDGGGSWNTEGWLGAVLRGSDLDHRSASTQRAQVRSFLTSAVDACLTLVDAR